MCVYICVCVCVYVCIYVHSYLPHHTLELYNRDTNSNTAIVLNFADFPKNASFKSYGVICLPRVEQLRHPRAFPPTA